MSKHITVKSPANIAFIKYWGTKDKKNILPFNDSFSMNLSQCITTVDMEIQSDPNSRQLLVKNYKTQEYLPDEKTLEKVVSYYSRIKNHLKINHDIGFTISSSNSFPKKAGIASSASFFSALALAFITAFGKKVSKKELSILARLSGSGSASRSVSDGFVWWHKGTSSKTSFSESIGSPSFWDIADVVLILSFEEKKVGSQAGHPYASTSPLFKYRLSSLPDRLKRIKKAFLKKDFEAFGEAVEEDAISMHSVMMTQKPPLFYMSGKTLEILKKTVALRENGVLAYFTIDAGENVHIICQKKDVKKITEYFQKQTEVEEIITNFPTYGARVIQ